MPAMTTDALKALLQAEKAASLGTDTGSTLAAERSRAMDYYLGDMAEDMPAPSDRSQAVSTDVSDTVEGLMPALMEIFASGDEVVAFEPVGAEDEEAAAQETDYVNHVFMQKNPGFLILYTFIKDALLSKVGIVKVWWQEDEREEEETYLNLGDDAYAALVAEGELQGFEVAEHTLTDDGLHDVTLRKVVPYGCATVANVPPEEFGISRRAKSIRDCDYCYHQTRVSESDLIEQGYDAEQVKSLQTADTLHDEEEEARDTVEDDSAHGDSGFNDATRLIWKTEHYVKCDYDGSGKPRLWRVTTGGDDAEVLKRDGKPDVVKVDMLPFATATPIILPHRFFGRSVADLVMDIQRIKTALTRGYLDQLYLTVNPPVEVAEAFSHERTLDDLLSNRPGKVVRTKQPGGITYHRPTSQGAEVLPAIEYFDATREWRTGVTRQGQGIDAKALQNQSATAVNQQFSMAQARMKLIARILAETGIRDLFSLLHAVIRKNDRQQNTVRLRGKWIQVNPREWKTREDMTISVGLGPGSKMEQLVFLQQILGIQNAALAAGGMGLVKPGNAYNTLRKMVEVAGLKSVEPYFTDPEAIDPNTGQPVNPPAQQPDPKLLELQMKAQIEETQARADIATQDRKVNSEIALAERKFELERELKLLEFQMKARESQLSHQMKVAERGLVARQGEGGEESLASAEDLRTERLEAGLAHLAQMLSSPVQIMRDENGRVIGARRGE